jgi:DNA-binding response OmpR family regulator
LKKQNQKRRILIVDDYSDTALSFKMGLQDDGFDVDAFDDPISALSAFKPDFYDLLVLDIEMDKINGFELYERIKKIDDKVKVAS